ncbi:hypothetical protein ABZU76_15305 [Amycolatopsis sp. NPDC005232]|uniref:hypothetical protein n=1 Tax=Amycolatopsis sp. NPDC005232 TaxID=3157027 RepID=UPI0033AD7E80
MALSNPGWAESFDTGGALIDIVVSDMTTDAWRRVFANFKAHPEVWTPCAGFERAGQMAADYAAATPDDRLLARGNLPGQLNAWFLDDELEIDLDPRQLTEDDHVVTLQGFMRELGQLLHRDVAMSWEGMREAVVFRYRYATDSID